LGEAVKGSGEGVARAIGIPGLLCGSGMEGRHSP
jgi:hypothetical protein